jgi:hypothetical protein
VSQYLYWLRWVLIKLRSRDPLYVPRRISYALRRRIVDLTFSRRQRARLLSSTLPKADDRLVYFRSRTRPAFHFGPGDIDRIVTLVPSEMREETIKCSEEIRDNCFRFRGRGFVISHPMNWGFQEKQNIVWTRDLNRHFFFTQLGFAYWYTKDSRFCDKFVELVTSWIESNAGRLGRLTWDHPFEVAARINAWIWAYFLFLHCPDWDASCHYRFLSALETITHYLYKTIEYHSPGNHVLLEAKALAACAILFPEFQEANRWQKKAWKILDVELDRQICRDGVHAERATMYHRIVTSELAELLSLSHQNDVNHEHTRKLTETVRKMVEFEVWIGSEHDRGPLFGDGYLTDSYIRFSPLRIVESLTGDVIKHSNSAQSTEQTYWVIGKKTPRNENSKILGSRTDVAKAFSYGGYYISRSGWEANSSVLVWDCGPVGYSANPSHGHLDALSFTLTVRGVPIIIDPGTDERDPEVRKYLRSTASHNTVLVDGEDQSIQAQRNEIWSPAQATLHLWATTPECDVMIGSHNGYKRLRSPVQHTRTIISMRNNYWLIYDRLEGDGSHKVEQRLNTAPGAAVEWTASGKVLSVNKQDVCLFVIPVTISDGGSGNPFQRTEIELGTGELQSGQRETILVLNTIRTGHMPFSIAAALVPGDTDSRVPSAYAVRPAGDVLEEVQIDTLNCNDKIYFRAGRRNIFSPFGDCETDAGIVILHRTKNDNKTDVFFVDACRVIAPGVSLFTNEAQPMRKLSLPTIVK